MVKISPVRPGWDEERADKCEEGMAAWECFLVVSPPPRER